MKTWSVVVIYEDPAARKEAVRFCDCFVERFWPGCDIDMSWWSFAQLRSHDSAHAATQKAAGADLIVFAAHPEGDLPLETIAWVENWLTQRDPHEGTLVGLLGTATGPQTAMATKHVYLRKIAHRGRMDYLTGLPQHISHHVPDSFESYCDRANRVTSVLDEILHQHHSPA